MASEISAALVGVIAGFIFSTLYAWWNERRLIGRERRHIASAILTEIVTQSDFLPWVRSVRPGLNSSSKAPPPPVVYPALADKVILLGSGPARLVIEFYTGLSWVRAIAENLARTEATEKDVLLLNEAADGVQRVGAEAVAALQQIAGPGSGQ